VGFRVSRSYFIHIHFILFWTAISHDHLSSLFHPNFCLDEPSPQTDSEHRDFGPRKENFRKKIKATHLASRLFKFGAALKVLRTIETFLPYICGPVNQAFQISDRLEEKGISSPVYTTYSDISPTLPKFETIGRVAVHRFKSQLKIMRYLVSAGMLSHFKNFDILHSHNYRNFQTDSGFFLLASKTNLTS
jgi:hypothetical protein